MPYDIIKSLLFFVSIAIIGVFIFQNQGYLGQPVELAFLPYRYSMALGFWLVLSFLLGALVWFALDLKKAYRLKSDLNRKDRRLTEMNDEIAELTGRIASLTGEIHALKNPRSAPDPL